tara:strand:+ start:396 stop:572 length:177 start_codon:yes stop_codon:yes gene_type:complete
VRFTDGIRKTFSLHNCENLEDAKKQAEDFRNTRSLEKGLTRNQFRLVECDIDGKYYEM